MTFAESHPVREKLEILKKARNRLDTQLQNIILQQNHQGYQTKADQSIKDKDKY